MHVTKPMRTVAALGVVAIVVTDTPIVIYFSLCLPKVIPVSFAAGILQTLISYDGVLLGLVSAIFGAFITLNYSKTNMKVNFLYLILLGIGVGFFVYVIITAFIDFVDVTQMNATLPTQGLSTAELGVLLSQSVNGVWAFILSMAYAILVSKEQQTTAMSAT